MKCRYGLIGLFILTLVFGMSHDLKAQEFVEYRYDDAGNRILRRVIVIPPKLSPGDSLQLMQTANFSIGESELSESVGQCQIKIYPNPTGGAFSLDIAGTYDVSTSKLVLSEMNGTIIHRWENLNASNNFSIQSQPSGTYLLTLDLNGSFESWKLIKK